MKNKTWIKKRHVFFTKVSELFLGPYTRRKYGIEVTKFEDSKNRQYLILFNHQTAFDQFFLGMAFKCPIYFLATEDIFSIGKFLSTLLTFSVAPIPIKKQTTDLNALKNLLQVAKEGGTIAIAPEGQRTYSGETTYINPAIVSMAKKLDLPIAIFKIEGGYGIQPRWSDVVRKGSMKAGVSRVIEPEEYRSLSREAFIKLIIDELYVNEACADGEYKHERLAEFLERTVYYCPDCGLSEFESDKDIISCKRCNKKIKYLPTKELKGVSFEFPYKFVLDWVKAQEKYLNSIDLTSMVNEPIYVDKAGFYKVIVYKRKELIWENALVELYGNRIEVTGDNHENFFFSFDAIRAVTVLGKNKVNIYSGKDVYQLKGDERFNALKYVNFYHRYKNISEGKANVEFLGL